MNSGNWGKVSNSALVSFHVGTDDPIVHESGNRYKVCFIVCLITHRLIGRLVEPVSIAILVIMVDTHAVTERGEGQYSANRRHDRTSGSDREF